MTDESDDEEAEEDDPADPNYDPGADATDDEDEMCDLISDVSSDGDSVYSRDLPDCLDLPACKDCSWKLKYIIVRQRYSALKSQHRLQSLRYKNMCDVIRKTASIPDDQLLNAAYVQGVLEDLHVYVGRLSNKKGSHATHETEYKVAKSVMASGVSANKFSKADESFKEVG